MLQARLGFVPYEKSGAGTFGSTFGPQAIKLLDPVSNRIQGLVKSIPFPDKRSVFNIGDYGAADGASSMYFIRDLIVTLREHHGHEVQFQIIYEDQEMNDFNTLFRRLMGSLPDPPSYMLELDNVYPLASGINFHKQCVPSSSMHFIMATVAVNWLSKPVPYKESLYVYPNSTEEEKKALNVQMRMDWESFLLLRSNELKHDGLLFVACDGEYVDDNGTVYFTMKTFVYVLTEVWRSFRDSGKIASLEFTNTNYVCCTYNPKHIKSPFEDQTSTVYQSGLRLLSAEIKIVQDVFYSAWKEKKEQTGMDDRQEFARSYVAAHRIWSNNMFLTGLSDNRTQQEKEQIVDELYERVESSMALMNPESFENDLTMCCVLIKKE